jgi:hypothetical protein
MPKKTPESVWREELRAYRRHGVGLTGKVFVPAEDKVIDCDVVDLSAGGAGVRCAEVPPLHTFVVLYVDGLGRFEAAAVRYDAGILGLRFQFGEAKRRRVAEALSRYVTYGEVMATRRRSHRRSPADTPLHIVRPNGERWRCDVVDVSLSGMSLRTSARPSVGEVVQVGRSYGRVIRHHDEGVALCLIAADDVPALAAI